MKKEWILYGLNAVLFAAVVALFVMFFTCRAKCHAPKSAATEIPAEQRMPIAYVNKDTLLQKYDLYVDMQEQLKLEESQSKKQIEKKAQDLQKAQAEFQEKYENNAFLNQQRAQTAYNDLLKKQRDLQDLDARLSRELMEKQEKMQKELRATIDSVIRAYNDEKGYQLIIGNSAGIGILDDLLYADPSYDVTDEVLERLNKKEE